MCLVKYLGKIIVLKCYMCYNIHMNYMSTLLASAVAGTQLLTGDFSTDVNRLKNCSILENLYSRREELGRNLNAYEQKLYRVLMPWYRQNCP